MTNYINWPLYHTSTAAKLCVFVLTAAFYLLAGIVAEDDVVFIPGKGKIM